ncbi:MAG: hypothetical protein UV74_C0001G0114 [Candidatus Woesebacteria bacterium GW2011_GWB1_43_14]|uniref:DUF4012 domain-containing protein n=1 Tax=Candidatus Woesebacteria bacterium GW2011_GWB1_43_14 TaxID=1618578 RepID=A0A0G1DMW8_9BACT|nr:MAG: hypothetical protein UV51_C0002G0103 [Candidatus Woesebacteria bacterium GW2011_GWC1_42_9]KKS99004.1 MAG: hypothetical protein UV74_C0001G0114 [Candidatus Woesebacteria bacterium GW2011_GWB1_43_14]
MVHIVDDNFKRWGELSEGLDHRKFRIHRGTYSLPNNSYYVIVNLKFSTLFTTVLNFAKDKNAKVLLLAPHLALKTEMNEALKMINEFDKNGVLVRTLYLGALIGEGVSETESVVMEMLKDAKQNNNIEIPENNQTLFLLNTHDAADSILRFLFTYQNSSKAILGIKLRIYDITKKVIFAYPYISTTKTKKLERLQIIRPDTVIEPRGDPFKFIEEYLSSREIVQKLHFPEPKKGKLQYGLYLKLVTAIFLFFIIPFISLFISGSLAVGSVYLIRHKKDEHVGILTKPSRFFARATKASIEPFDNLPLVGGVYTEAYSVANTIERGTYLADKVSVVKDHFSKIISGIRGDEVNVDVLLTEAYLEIDSAYIEISFLENEIKENELFLSGFYKDIIQISKARESLFYVREILSSAPTLLGFNRQTTYMVLFQNNMELRPTGGFIGSFALVTFNKGKLIDSSVFDVYSADGQLKGYITPPDPIKVHLGEPSWYLRDSNWDPDFPTSAKRAEWFLEKSLDRQVDGVMGIDLEVVGDLLSIVGPLNIPDFEDTIDSKNLYDKIQFEVENDFFPGSKKKANYLTALSNTLISSLSQINSSQYYDIANILLNDLQSRDIQIFLHETSSQAVIKDLGWDGSINHLECVGNCATSWLGVVEANVGVNKANYYVNRASNLKVEIENDKIINTLSLAITNSATTNSYDPKSRYKAYVRVMAPNLANFSKVEIVNGKNRETLNPDLVKMEDRIEVGVLVVVNPGESSLIKFKWSFPGKLDFNKKGKVEVYWRKQAGVSAHPVSVEIIRPFVSLTSPNSIIYNTDLARDALVELNW